MIRGWNLFKNAVSALMLWVALVLLSFAPAWAQDDHCVTHHIITVLGEAPANDWKLDFGTKVHVQPKGQDSGFDATFAGRSYSTQNKESYHFFKHGSSDELYIAEQDPVRLKFSNGDPLASFWVRSSPQSACQIGNTCAAYATFNALRHVQYIGIRGNGLLSRKLDNPTEQDAFLASIITRLYGNNNKARTLDEAISTYAASYGFHVLSFSPWTHPFKDTMLKHLKKGLPVIMRFDIATTQTPTPYRLLELSGAKDYAERLWIPRRANDPKHSDGIGHAVLATGTFEHNGKQYIIVVDSNWSQPRLWDADLLDRADDANMRAWVIH